MFVEGIFAKLLSCEIVELDSVDQLILSQAQHQLATLCKDCICIHRIRIFSKSTGSTCLPWSGRVCWNAGPWGTSIGGRVPSGASYTQSGMRHALETAVKTGRLQGFKSYDYKVPVFLGRCCTFGLHQKQHFRFGTWMVLVISGFKSHSLTTWWSLQGCKGGSCISKALHRGREDSYAWLR